jgi:serine/threonine protein phosphatase Stp1
MIGRGMLRRWHRSEAEALPPADPPIAEAAARSHVGRVRQINEDRFLARSERGLWAVADGMGGHAAGGEAADAAIDELAALTDGDRVISEAAICAALERANRRIHDGGARRATSGTTIVVAWLHDDVLTVLWAGDSRAYRLRDGEARCLTRDHSLVQDLIDAGQITPAEAERHPDAHIITRALGAAHTVEIDRVVVDTRPGDRFMLCSDGVSRSLDVSEMAADRAALGPFADALLDTALRRDGSDNTTLVAIQLAAAPPCGEGGTR